MLVMQLLRGTVKHAGSSPQCSAKRLSSAVRGISSSLQQSCTDTDHPKVLITGCFFALFCCFCHCLLLIQHFVFQAMTFDLYGNSFFSFLLIVTGGLGQLGVGFAKLLRYRVYIYNLQLFIYFQRWNSCFVFEFRSNVFQVKSYPQKVTPLPVGQTE